MGDYFAPVCFRQFLFDFRAFFLLDRIRRSACVVAFPDNSIFTACKILLSDILSIILCRSILNSITSMTNMFLSPTNLTINTHFMFCFTQLGGICLILSTLPLSWLQNRPGRCPDILYFSDISVFVAI